MAKKICERCGDPIEEYQKVVHSGCALLEPCSNCEEWVDLQDIELTQQEKDLGFTRKFKCPECGDVSGC